MRHIFLAAIVVILISSVALAAKKYTQPHMSSDGKLVAGHYTNTTAGHTWQYWYTLDNVETKKAGDNYKEPFAPVAEEPEHPYINVSDETDIFDDYHSSPDDTN
jgi:hypothetical protein